MIINAQDFDPGKSISTDICIVGAGPVGVVLANELAKNNYEVCLLEAGNFETSEAAQDHYRGEIEGDWIQQLHVSRRLQFGGTANVWDCHMGDGRLGVRFLPLDAIDFEKRDWFPYSGWPFRRADIEPYFVAAQKVCQLGPWAYDGCEWATEQMPCLPFRGDRVTTTMFQFGPKDIYYRQYREEMEASGKVTIVLNANVLEMETDPNAQRVTAVRAASAPGRDFRVQANRVVLAAGGLEVPRLMLLSNQVQKEGLGNQNDLVGRFFMEHPLDWGDKFVPNDPTIFERMALYDIRRDRNASVMAKLSLTPKALEQEHILGMSALFYPRRGYFRSPAYVSMKAIKQARDQGKTPEQMGRHLRNVALGGYEIAAALIGDRYAPVPAQLNRGGWSKLHNPSRPFRSFEVFYQIEQAPDPNNRVVLTEHRDTLGRRRIKLHNHITELDRHTYRRAKEVYAEELARAGLGRLEVYEKERPYSLGSHHHMGTTRMHNDPKQGVTDAQCRVHGVANLYIASSSIFPTGGYANPTLTSIALVLRLIDHFKAHPIQATTLSAPSH